MATRRKTTEETPVTESDFDFDAVQPVKATAPVVKFKHNPLQKWVADSIAGNYPDGTVDESGYIPLEITVPTDKASDALNMLRRAALPKDKGGLDTGLRLAPKDNGDGTTTIGFQAKKEKKARSYTMVDVRKWAEANDCPKEDIYPRVKPGVSRAYRIAHNLPVADQK